MASPQYLQVWSIQTERCVEQFRQQGVLRGDGRRVWRQFRSPYLWLKQQMAGRLDSYHGGWPVWFWVKPVDLRKSAHLPRGARGVRLELRVPRERVLLLDFSTWHVVLNGGYLALTEQEDEQWDRETRKLLDTGPGLPSRNDPNKIAAIQQRMRESWARVFDLEALRKSPYAGGPDLIVQGVAEYFLWDEVVRLKPFVAR